jgi:hypothetical protein
MRFIDSTVLVNIAAGFSSERLMVRLDLGSGSTGFWQGDDPLAYNGVTYNGFSSMLEMDPFDEGSEFASQACVVRLRAVPVQFLTPDRIASIEAEQYHQRPAIVTIAHLNPDTRSVLFFEQIFSGRIDQITHVQGDTEYTLEARLESLARDYTAAGHREQSYADQLALDGTDTGLIFAANAGKQEIYWGKRPPGGVKGERRDRAARARPRL